MRIVLWVLAGVCYLLMGESSLAWNSASGDAIVRKSCTNQANMREAREVFKKGVLAFERKDFLESAYRMLQALDFNCGEQLTVVVPYGRWRYRYMPKEYLGISLRRLGGCLTEGRNCSRTRDWGGNWSDFLENQLGEGWQEFVVDADLQSQCTDAMAEHDANPLPASQSVECDSGKCLMLRGSNADEFYCPVIDWWIKLGAAGMDVPVHEEPDQIEERCGQVETPVEWFWTALRGRNQCSNRQLCTKLTKELSEVEHLCGILQLSGG